ncbi:hypothetical protein [Paremcibacter congregatus]|uniref:hypothetical protein n=1 Tax=Paremcibacter congregatus TaxID=2043170 RepID=UPI0011216D1A|nr:hypothetical protein [Paremcibacter congregatus]QDE27285.1 hypothetical protein FIV45_08295 [Paremcibacter congregatus]
MAEEASVESYSAGGFFGDLVNAAGNLGSKYLDFKWSSNQLDEERRLAAQYNAAVTNQAIADTPRAESQNSDLVKYGLFAFAGLAALLVILKVAK